MKRFFAATILLASLAIALKLALKPAYLAAPARPTSDSQSSQPRAQPHREAAGAGTSATQFEADDALFGRFPNERERIDRLIESYGHNARRIAAQHGLRGLLVLDAMGDTAVCLFEERPGDFRSLCGAVGAGPDSEQLLAAWRNYFDPRRADIANTELLAHEIERLPARARRIASRTHEALPFLLAESRRTSDVIERYGHAALEPLAMIDLSDGGDSLRRALGTFERHGELALAAWNEFGPAGFLLVERYGPLVAELESSLGVRDSLLAVANAADDIDELQPTHRPVSLARAMRHLKNRDVLADVVTTRFGLRLVVEFGRDGERVLEATGPRAAELIYECAEGPIRNAVVRAIADAGPAAAAAVEKFRERDDFSRVIERDGAAAILAVAAANSADESREFLAAKSNRTWTESLALTALRLAGDCGEKTIRTIERDGIDRVASLSKTDIEFYQLLPLYDLSHLGGVLVHGQLPTRGELAWAGIDASLVAFDAVSLLAMQPEGAAAGEAARSAAKSATRVTVRVATAAAEHEAASLSERAAETATATLTKSLAARAGIRLSRLPLVAALHADAESLLKLPAHRLTKYVTINVVQAGVGTLAISKMDEYVAGRRAAESAAHDRHESGKDESHED